MRISSSNLIPSLTLTSLLAFASGAGAFPTTRTYDVFFDTLAVGSLTFRNRVIETEEYTCEYTARWHGLTAPLTRTRICRIQEQKAGDHFDCEANRRKFFATLVFATGFSCNGFDEFGQATRIPTLVAGETPFGEFFGVAMTESIGDIVSLEIAVRPPSLSTVVAAPSISPLTPRF